MESAPSARSSCLMSKRPVWLAALALVLSFFAAGGSSARADEPAPVPPLVAHLREHRTATQDQVRALLKKRNKSKAKKAKRK